MRYWGRWDAVDVVPYKPEMGWVENTALSPATNMAKNPFYAFLDACSFVISVFGAVL